MLVSDAQRESRTVYLGGSVGQLMSAVVWLASATVGTLAGPTAGFWALALGGVAIFPVTQTALRLAGRRVSLSPGNPFRGLAMQVAFTVPLAFFAHGVSLLFPSTIFIPGW